MISPPLFPSLPGQGWSVHKRPVFSTRVSAHASGREIRTAMFEYPLYEFELTFDALDSAGLQTGLQPNSLQTLLGFYLQRQGQFGVFLYVDPTDCFAARQTLAIGDGATNGFVCQRALGGFVEPVSWVQSVSNVSVGGVGQTSGWSLSQPNLLEFVDPPPAGAAIVADVSYAFTCRFLEDQNDFENFMSGLWKVDSLKFRSVRT